uniref:Uncharacterized protein n=1 Tax=Ditylenchus dipsaci TaxID=166011 RepID=A0A915EM79_9BILA
MEVEVKNEEEVQPLMEEIQLHSTLSMTTLCNTSAPNSRRETMEIVFSSSLWSMCQEGHKRRECASKHLQWIVQDLRFWNMQEYMAPELGCTMIEMVTGRHHLLS